MAEQFNGFVVVDYTSEVVNNNPVYTLKIPAKELLEAMINKTIVYAVTAFTPSFRYRGTFFIYDAVYVKGTGYTFNAFSANDGPVAFKASTDDAYPSNAQ